MRVDVVIPTTRPQGVARLLAALDGFEGRVIVVDGNGIAPAAARNIGWRRSLAQWVCFLDDEVIPEAGWERTLRAELARAGEDVAGVQGRIVVPMPRRRRPTDWEREVGALEGAAWATADMAYRRGALERVGGFDERLRSVSREDADLALRVMAQGMRLIRGRRRVVHPVGPAGPWVSVARQRGTADDVLMRATHGRDWRIRARVPEGALRRHMAATVAGTVAVTLLAGGRRRPAAVAGAAWLALTAVFGARRIAPGPRNPREVATMLATSVAIPPAAAAWWLVGHLRQRRRHRGI
ncbi:MAG: glycosyltransferase [Thermoleophilia bacterium]